jgi:hypothetical protein
VRGERNKRELWKSKYEVWNIKISSLGIMQIIHIQNICFLYVNLGDRMEIQQSAKSSKLYA